jgi:hypothetical protein
MESREEKLKDFLNRLQKLSWARPEEPGKNLYHLGAIVCAEDDGVEVVAKEVSNSLPSKIISLPKDLDYFDETVQEVNKDGLTLIIILSSDLSELHIALELFKKISHFNDISPWLADERIIQNPKVRFITVFSKDTWSKQSYPSFIDLFGVICRLDD